MGPASAETFFCTQVLAFHIDMNGTAITEKSRRAAFGQRCRQASRATASVRNCSRLLRGLVLHAILSSQAAHAVVALQPALPNQRGAERVANDALEAQSERQAERVDGRPEPIVRKQAAKVWAEVALDGSITQRASVDETSGSGTALEQDLSLLDDTHYLSFDAALDVDANSNKTFDFFIMKTKLSPQMTKGELAMFAFNFKESMSTSCKSAGCECMTDLEMKSKWWRKVTGLMLQESKPLQTEQLLRAINSKHIGWKAAFSQHLQGVTIRDFKKLLGPRIDLPCHDQSHAANSAPADSSPSLAEKDEERSYFDSRIAWPLCHEVLGRVRDQGSCANGWALATAGLVDGRLCISGHDSELEGIAELSAGYLTSCAGGDGADGCEGGSPEHALRFLLEEGVPTGGAGNTSETCVPYFATSTSLAHVVGQGEAAPPCPRECYNSLYQRSLQEDIFRPSGLALSSGLITDIHKVKQSIEEHGNILMLFGVYQEFASYKGGVFRPTPTARGVLGYHVAQAIGYGPDYILAVNSWGPEWGLRGLFKYGFTLADGSPNPELKFLVPGELNAVGTYPYPLPSSEVDGASGSFDSAAGALADVGLDEASLAEGVRCSCPNVSGVGCNCRTGAAESLLESSKDSIDVSDEDSATAEPLDDGMAMQAENLVLDAEDEEDDEEENGDSVPDDSDIGDLSIDADANDFDPDAIPASFAAGGLLEESEEPVGEDGQDDVGVMFQVSQGNCQVQRDCAMSDNYPGPYLDGGSCVIEVTESPQHKLQEVKDRLQVQHFITERIEDTLTFVSQDDKIKKVFSGENGPHDLELSSGKLVWSADNSRNERGWKVCIKRNSSAPKVVFESYRWCKPPEGLIWTVCSPEHSACLMDEALCITSPEYPHGSGGGSSCTVGIMKNASVVLDVMDFATEPLLDVLVVNGEHYSGSHGPHEVEARGVITWSADQDQTGGAVAPHRGWKICPRSAKVP
mmetsp:Transcript_69495/g.166577  ORF Transcript_69495/g.166577 Transcript_69495/m.166577 type:complete len:973 (-) Transcript_69495:55-2973(-)